MWVVSTLLRAPLAFCGFGVDVVHWVIVAACLLDASCPGMYNQSPIMIFSFSHFHVVSPQKPPHLNLMAGFPPILFQA